MRFFNIGQKRYTRPSLAWASMLVLQWIHNFKTVRKGPRFLQSFFVRMSMCHLVFYFTGHVFGFIRDPQATVFIVQAIHKKKHSYMNLTVCFVRDLHILFVLCFLNEAQRISYEQLWHIYDIYRRKGFSFWKNFRRVKPLKCHWNSFGCFHFDIKTTFWLINSFFSILFMCYHSIY